MSNKLELLEFPGGGTFIVMISWMPILAPCHILPLLQSSSISSQFLSFQFQWLKSDHNWLLSPTLILIFGLEPTRINWSSEHIKWKVSCEQCFVCVALSRAEPSRRAHCLAKPGHLATFPFACSFIVRVNADLSRAIHETKTWVAGVLWRPNESGVVLEGRTFSDDEDFPHAQCWHLVYWGWSVHNISHPVTIHSGGVRIQENVFGCHSL